MASASEGQSTTSAQEEETTGKEEETTGKEEERHGSTEQADAEGSAEDRQSAPEGSQDSDGAQDSGDHGAESSGDGDDGDQQEGVASGRSMARAIEDVSSLPGETVNDQDGRKIGDVKHIYAVGEDETPMWVTIESSTGVGRTRELFVPLARIKNQNDELRVPYSYDHIHEAPEVEPGDEISEEDDRALRGYFGIGLGDQEMVQAARSYASQVPDDEGPASKIEGDAAEGPVRELDDTPPAKAAAEAYEKQKEEEGEEHRKGREATASDVVEEDGGEGGGKKDDEESEGKSSSDEEPESKEESEGKSSSDEPEGKKDSEGKDE